MYSAPHSMTLPTFISKPFEPKLILEKVGKIFGVEYIPDSVETHDENFGKTELDTIDIKIIAKAAYFYNIGMMGIPTELVDKKEAMTGAEREIYENHTILGSNIIWINRSENCKFFVKVCSDICMHHHERYDGLGFPHGLKCSDNSLYSQLCSLAIRFDKLFVKRKEYNDVQFDFVMNELRFDRGAFSAEHRELLAKCRGSVIITEILI